MTPRQTLTLVCGLWLLLWGLLMYTHKRIPSRIYWRAMWNLAISAVVLTLASVFLPACSPQASAPERMAPPDPRDAVVVLQCNKTYFDETDNSWQVEKIQCCNAVAVREGPGAAGVKLLTAAHCLFSAGSGADVGYNTRDDITAFVHVGGPRLARVLRVDKAHDRAELSPVELGDAIELGRSALAVGASEPDGPVRTISGYYGWSSLSGAVVARVWGEGGSYYITDLDVKHGWSGSPVLDARGRVVGVVISCDAHPVAVGDNCVPRSGNFAGLDGFW